MWRDTLRLAPTMLLSLALAGCGGWEADADSDAGAAVGRSDQPVTTVDCNPDGGVAFACKPGDPGYPPSPLTAAACAHPPGGGGWFDDGEGNDANGKPICLGWGDHDDADCPGIDQYLACNAGACARLSVPGSQYGACLNLLFVACAEKGLLPGQSGGIIIVTPPSCLVAQSGGGFGVTGNEYCALSRDGCRPFGCDRYPCAIDCKGCTRAKRVGANWTSPSPSPSPSPKPACESLQPPVATACAL